MFSVTFLSRELFFPGSPGIYADDEAIFTEPRRRFRTHRGSESDLSGQEVRFPTFANLHFYPIGLNFGLEVQKKKSILRGFALRSSVIPVLTDAGVPPPFLLQRYAHGSAGSTRRFAPTRRLFSWLCRVGSAALVAFGGGERWRF